MRYAGQLAALGTAVCWAAGSNFFAAAAARMGAAVLNRLRISVACVFLAIALTVTHGAPYPFWASPRQIVILALSGLIGFVFGDGWYFKALVILGPGRASLLASTAPLFTALIAWPLLHEKLGAMAISGMVLTLGGVAFVMSERAGASAGAGSGASSGASSDARPPHAEGSVTLGIIAGLLAALGQAGGYVLSKSALQSGIDPLSATVIRVSSAAAGIWLLTAVQGAVPQTVGALRDRRASAFMVAGAFFGPFLGVTLSLTAIHYIATGVAASITAIYPLLTLAISARFHGERLTLRTAIGAGIAIAGVVVLFLK